MAQLTLKSDSQYVDSLFCSRFPCSSVLFEVRGSTDVIKSVCVHFAFHLLSTQNKTVDVGIKTLVYFSVHKNRLQLVNT